MVKAVFLLLALAITVSYIDGSNDKIIEVVKKCFGETGASKDDSEKVRRREVPTTKEGKCFAACYFKAFGIITDGKYSAERVIRIFGQILEKGKPAIEKVAKMTQTCEKNLEGITDECELGAQVIACERPFLEKLNL